MLDLLEEKHFDLTNLGMRDHTQSKESNNRLLWYRVMCELLTNYTTHHGYSLMLNKLAQKPGMWGEEAGPARCLYVAAAINDQKTLQLMDKYLPPDMIARINRVTDRRGIQDLLVSKGVDTTELPKLLDGNIVSLLENAGTVEGNYLTFLTLCLLCILLNYFTSVIIEYIPG